MSRRQHDVALASDRRAALQQRIRSGTAPAWELTRCRIVLQVDAAQPGRRQTDAQVAKAVEVSARTVARVRRDFAQGGLERATTRKTPARVYRHRLDGAAEAKLVELACGPAPAGQQRWSVQLLRDELIRLDLVEHVAVSTVHRTLKKTNCSPGASRSGALPS
jgi:hypothetical protein